MLTRLLCLPDALADIINDSQPMTQPTEFRFEWTRKAAHYLAVLQHYALDLGTTIRTQPLSALTFGSKYCPVELFAPWTPRTHCGKSSRTAFPRAPICPSFPSRTLIVSLTFLPSWLTASTNRVGTMRHSWYSCWSKRWREAGSYHFQVRPHSKSLGCNKVAHMGNVAQTSINEKGNPTGSSSPTTSHSIPGKQPDKAWLTGWTTHISPFEQLMPSATDKSQLVQTTNLVEQPNPASKPSGLLEVITDPANDLVRRTDWDSKVFHSQHQHLLNFYKAMHNDKVAAT